MSDTANTVIAAFGGGLLGAVLQPLLAHAMDRLRSKETRMKLIERRLRKMVTSWLEFTMGVSRLSWEVLHRRQLGMPQLSREEMFQRTRVMEYSFPTWEPERIKDPTMRQLADELYNYATQVQIELQMPGIADDAIQGKIEGIGELR